MRRVRRGRGREEGEDASKTWHTFTGTQAPGRPICDTARVIVFLPNEIHFGVRAERGKELMMDGMETGNLNERLQRRMEAEQFQCCVVFQTLYTTCISSADSHRLTRDKEETVSRHILKVFCSLLRWP